MTLAVKSLSANLNPVVELELGRGNTVQVQLEDDALKTCSVSFAEPLDLEGGQQALSENLEVQANTFGPQDPDFDQLGIEGPQLGFMCLATGHWVGGPDPSPPAPPEEVLARLSPPLRAIVDDELARGNHLFSAYDEDGFIQVTLEEPIAFERHQPPPSVERFRSPSPIPTMPTMAGYGDNESGHSIAGPDAEEVLADGDEEQDEEEVLTPEEHNRRLPTDLDPIFEWSELDGPFLEKAKRRAAKGFRWSKESSLRAASDVMLGLWVFGRDTEALEAAYFLSQLLFEGDFALWGQVEPAHALIARHARGGGDLELAQMARATLQFPGLMDERLEGVVAEHARDNADLQRPGSAARRDWLLPLLAELLVLSAVLEPEPFAEEIASIRAELREMLQ